MGFLFEHVGNTIREMRNEQGLTLKELAEGICDFGTLSRIERGEHENPRRKNLEDIIERLGAKDFYLRLGSGQRLEAHRRKEEIKNQIISSLKYGRSEIVEELLMELRTLIENECGEDMQLYLTLQSIWYKMRGVSSIKNWSKRYIEIFEMSQNYPKASEDIKHATKGVKLNSTEQLIANNVGISLLIEGKPKLACKAFMGLFVIMTNDEVSEQPIERKKLAKLCNNIAIAAMECGWIETASNFCNYAKLYTSTSKDIELITITEKTSARLAERSGFVDTAKKHYNKIECLEQILYSLGTDMCWFKGQIEQRCGIEIL